MKSKLIIAFVALFLAFWVLGMTSGLMASACQKQHHTKRLSYCNISIVVGSVLPGSAEKKSVVYLERGILLADLGRQDEALKDMKRAVSDAANGRVKLILQGIVAPSNWFEKLRSPISREDVGSVPRAIWKRALDECARSRSRSTC